MVIGDSLVKTEEYEEEANPLPRWEEVKINIPSFLTAVKGLLMVDPKQRKSARDVLKILYIVYLSLTQLLMLIKNMFPGFYSKVG